MSYNPGEDPANRGQTESTSIPQKTLRSMISDAVSKSRGQGVVQGSTLFFKNLADSISHSNRNLKIGLAFLTATFSIVALTLAFLVLQTMKRQVGTDELLKRLPTEVQQVIEPIRAENEELKQRMAKLEADSARQIESVRVNAQAEVDRAREEAAKVREDLNRVSADLSQVKKQMQLADQIYPAKIEGLDRRLREVEKR